ncbi:monovalent cation/H+ antiporter subunit D [Aquincola agrisoli]
MIAAVLMLAAQHRRRWHLAINLAATAGGMALALMLLHWVKHNDAPGAVGVYLPGNWNVPFGIVLVADRLSALMLVLTSGVALAALVFAIARWDRAGVYFHPLFQLQLMGLNGVFLTADLFNLFVFFEVMLSASYGLLLHGSGRWRVRAGLHYLVINLAASALFLVGVSMLYGVTGTLNMADMAQRIALVAPEDRGLLHAGAAILAIAFLTKAAMWPLNFWLVPAYTAASAPVGALFAIMTKVGIYTVLRLWSLMFPATAGVSAFFGGRWLLVGGILTLSVAALSMLASQKVDRLAALAVVVSSGTLMAVVSFAQPAVTAGALFYLVSSTLALSALFLLAELIERSRQIDTETEHAEAHRVHFPVEDLEPSELDAQGEAITGRAIPAAMAFLGVSFIACTLLVAGMPPLSGFVAKFSLLSALANPLGLGGFDWQATSRHAWLVLGLLIGSGLLSLVALTGAGVRYFWTPLHRPAPRLKVIECLPIAGLLLACVLLTVHAEAVLRYTRATTEALQTPSLYIEAVMSTQPLPSPTDPRSLPEVPR